jgi:hypothetical protein
LVLKADAVGTVTLNTLQVTGGAAAGYVLTSDSTGTASWAPPAIGKYVGLTTGGPYNGAASGYSNVNSAVCGSAANLDTGVAGAHACSTEEILSTIVSGAGASIPPNTTLWISNGPPGYFANANDCIGWTSASSTDYGTVWVKLGSGDGFGSVNVCDSSEPRQFACCK